MKARNTTLVKNGPPESQSSPGEAILEVEQLTKVFRGAGGHAQVALDGVSFSLQAGGSLAVVGESGSGKTTAARIIAGLDPATSGTVTVDGRRVAGGGRKGKGRSRRAEDVRAVQMVFQDPFGSLDPRQRVGAGLGELLSIHFGLSRTERADRVSQLLNEVGLDVQHAEQFPRTLSGGQRQRVAIARALAVEPKVLILDEAVSALDVSVQAQVLNLLADIRAETGISYLFVSHDLGVVRQVTDTCVVLSGGAVVEAGTTSQVLDSPREPYTQALLEAVPKAGWQPRRRTADEGAGR